MCPLSTYTPTPSPTMGGVSPPAPGEESNKGEEEGEETDEMVYRPTRDTLFGFQVTGAGIEPAAFHPRMPG